MERSDLLPCAKPVYTTRQKWLVLFALGLGAAFRVLWCEADSLWYFSAFCALLAASFAVWQWPRAKRNASAWVVLAADAALMVLLPIQARLEYMDWMIFFGLLAIPALLLLYAVLVMFPIPEKRESMVLHGLVYGAFVLPFTSVARFFGAAAAAVSGKTEDRKGRVKPVLLGLIVGLPLLAAVLALLSGADARMGKLLTGLLDGIDLGGAIGTVITVLFTAMFSYSFFYGSAYRQKTLRPLPDAVWSAATLTVIGALLLAAYALFLGLQFSYLFGGTLPEAYTYSEYARAGFSELVLVSLINFTLIGLSVRYGEARPHLRAVVWLLLAATVLLLASAALRLLLYIGAYGLTLRRILSLWLMVYLAALSALTAVRLLRARLPLVRIASFALIFYFTALYAVDWGAVAGAWNGAH